MKCRAYAKALHYKVSNTIPLCIMIGIIAALSLRVRDVQLMYKINVHYDLSLGGGVSSWADHQDSGVADLHQQQTAAARCCQWSAHIRSEAPPWRLCE